MKNTCLLLVGVAGLLLSSCAIQRSMPANVVITTHPIYENDLFFANERVDGKDYNFIQAFQRGLLVPVRRNNEIIVGDQTFKSGVLSANAPLPELRGLTVNQAIRSRRAGFILKDRNKMNERVSIVLVIY